MDQDAVEEAAEHDDRRSADAVFLADACLIEAWLNCVGRWCPAEDTVGEFGRGREMTLRRRDDGRNVVGARA
jgi:hypothetical protein